MIRRTLVSCVAGALALVFIVTPVAPEAQGRGGQGGLPALQQQVQALEQAVANVTAALDTLGTGDAALQAQIVTLSEQVAGLQDVFASLNTAVNTASGDILSLKDRVLALEAALAELGDGLTSYDQLADLPCKTGANGDGTVHLIGLLKSPVCAAGISANSRFIDLGPVVLDTQTNLIWEKKTTAVESGANSSDLHDVDNLYNWCVATGNTTNVCVGNTTSWIGQVNAETFAGFNDWRVATQDELLAINTALTGCSSGPPCIIDSIFEPMAAAIYWSSGEFIDFGLDLGCAVRFSAGFPNLCFTKLDEYHVRAVRSGP